MDSISDEGKALFIDLGQRLIGRILEFNPEQHDIELNLVGIIEKAKQVAEKDKRIAEMEEIVKERCGTAKFPDAPKWNAKKMLGEGKDGA